jgi:hypothetical protein
MVAESYSLCKSTLHQQFLVVFVEEGKRGKLTNSLILMKSTISSDVNWLISSEDAIHRYRHDNISGGYTRPANSFAGGTTGGSGAGGC